MTPYTEGFQQEGYELAGLDKSERKWAEVVQEWAETGLKWAECGPNVGRNVTHL